MKKMIALTVVLAIVLSLVPLGIASASGGRIISEKIRILTENGNDFLDKALDKAKAVLEKGADYFKEKVKKFSDMGSHWADVTVGKLVELGVINGYNDGMFKPNSTINRAEFAKIVRIALDMELVEGNSFKDTGNMWAKNEIHTLVVNGAIDKDEYGEIFDPYGEITRLEMAKIIVRVMGLDEEAKEKAGERTSFNDDSDIPSDDKGYIILASEYGIINGTPEGTFLPNNSATRAEACKVVICMLEALDEIKETPVGDGDSEEENNFIEPEFRIESSYGGSYLTIFIDNKEEYYEAGGYEIKGECISHPFLNQFSMPKRYGGYGTYDRTIWREIKYPVIYAFDIGPSYTTIENYEKYPDIEGLKVKIKVLIRNDKEEREYIIEGVCSRK